VTTFPSSIRSSRALWQISRTWASGIGLQARSCAIALRVPLIQFVCVLVKSAAFWGGRTYRDRSWWRRKRKWLGDGARVQHRARLLEARTQIVMQVNETL
jgi:hypothetical protein